MRFKIDWVILDIPLDEIFKLNDKGRKCLWQWIAEEIFDRLWADKNGKHKQKLIEAFNCFNLNNENLVKDVYTETIKV